MRWIGRDGCADFTIELIGQHLHDSTQSPGNINDHEIIKVEQKFGQLTKIICKDRSPTWWDDKDIIKILKGKHALGWYLI